MPNLQNKLPVRNVPNRNVSKVVGRGAAGNNTVQKYSGTGAATPFVKKLTNMSAEFYQHNIAMLPNASIVYCIGAAVLFVYSIYLLLIGFFFTAFLIFFMASCLVGFAWQMFKQG